jgi:molecular chaperone GrpE
MLHPTDLREEEIMRHDESLKTSKIASQFDSEPENHPRTEVQEADGNVSTVEANEEAAPRAELERLQSERDQLLDRLARLQAEFENYRKREAKERAEYRDYALANTVEQFLPVLDNFHLALRSQGSAEQLRSGVDLIVRQMEEIVRSLGVQPIPTVETQFDPRLHEAIEMVERDDLPDHQVMEEVRRGYTLRDRLLRPALVRVANNPKQKKA